MVKRIFNERKSVLPPTFMQVKQLIGNYSKVFTSKKLKAYLFFAYEISPSSFSFIFLYYSFVNFYT